MEIKIPNKRTFLLILINVSLAMGNVLRYIKNNNDKINKSVLNNINKGNMTTLNCPEEVLLAKQIIEHHPWASMAKFTRGGGEANALAIRIARSNTRKKNVIKIK